jgi:phage terminase large subunit
MNEVVNRREVLGSALSGLVPIKGPTSHDRLLDTLDLLVPATPRNDAYPKDPVQFMRDVLGFNPWTLQETITRLVWENRYTSVASCHGIGKSTLAAAIALTFLHLHENSIVLSTAPTGRQVEAVLWRNIRAMHRKAKRPLLGQKPLTLRYDIAEEWYGMGFKPSDQETDPTQGFHAEYVLVIIDEAAGVPVTLIDGFHAAMTTEGSRFLMIGNPTSTSGPFYDSHHSKSADYATLNVSWEDTPNFQAGHTVIKGLITQQWVDETIKKYGIDSPYVRSRVYSEWVDPDDVLIPLAQIEAARNRDWTDLMGMTDDPKHAGLDVARDGSDKSVLSLRSGAYVLGQFEVPGKESYETAGATLDLLKHHQAETTELKVDVIGIGAGVYDVLSRIVQDRSEWSHMTVTPVNFAKKANDIESYNNQRSEAYGVIAERFRLGQIGGKIHDQCQADLTGIKGKFDGRHSQRVIEPKEAFRERNGHSPDHGDSLVLAFYDPPYEGPITMGALAFGYAETRWGRL